MILEILEWSSTILYFIVGIIGSTKLSIKLKIKVHLNVIGLVANTLWMLWCIGFNAYGYFLTGILYAALYIISIVVFYRMYKKAKSGKEYKII